MFGYSHQQLIEAVILEIENLSMDPRVKSITLDWQEHPDINTSKLWPRLTVQFVGAEGIEGPVGTDEFSGQQFSIPSPSGIKHR